jgi:protein tyrosine/serine phosphatase
MRKVALPTLAILSLAAGCAHTYTAAPLREAAVGADHENAFAALSSSRGPDRFAQVTPLLYRGGQPDPAQLELLAALGVKTIITFVTDGDVVKQETAAAAKLGMTVRSHPFYGMSTPSGALLTEIVDELKDASAPVYVHCKQGRDRTSLVVALYRVWVEGWDPGLAWQREAVDFGHGGLRTLFFRGLDRTYARLTHRG